ncbi:Beta antigen [Jannaschia seosinensis]|uniref:Beta antigen n=1 Tax=Jannaschia seosinensis TaxID=313367 RepID=A0A0M7BC83_9RHOB|nr:MerR family transcriptional regulator [Jannaschia seosinensis]CUH39678.1 Beta antigen [Jannaschia seosinensis]
MAGPSEKSEGAFRTIREVADWLGVPTHVLRFWESKFDQIAPVKGAGGRRYYRPEDMRLLGGIKVMLHDQGLTVRGVAQRIDQDGIDAVTALSPEIEGVPTPAARARKVIRQQPEPESDRVVPFGRGKSTTSGEGDAPAEPAPAVLPPKRPSPEAPPQPDMPVTPAQPEEPVHPDQPDDSPIKEPAAPPQPDVPEDAEVAPEPAPEPRTSPAPEPIAPPPAATATLRVETKIDRRRLRRVVLRLRGVIADVEAELSQSGTAGPES